MIWRILLIVPVALLVWWFAYQHLRADDANWFLWLMHGEASRWWRVVWGLVSFAGTVAVLGGLALFYRRSWLAFAAITLAAVVFSNLILVGLKASGSIVTPQVFASLALGLASSFPLTFSHMIAGKQIDIVGDGE